ncbi:hypothetical protein MRX96_011962 [Rhipicephalus microplus]
MTPLWSKNCIRELSVPDSVEQLRRFLQVQGPSDLGELLNGQSPSQARDVPQRHGTLNAFIEQLPGLILAHGDVYTFVYYEEPNGEEYEFSGSSHLQYEADAGPSSTTSDNGRYSASNDGEYRRAFELI